MLDRVLRAAGRAALARLVGPGGLRAWRKPDGTALTDADLAAHEVLVEGLLAAFPGDRVRSEEGPADGEGGAPGGGTWYVDPVDGTDALVEGLAHWGPTVCRVVDGRLDVGAFYVPRLDELWFAARGAGAWRDGVRLAPAEPERLDRATVYLPSRAHRLPEVPWPGKSRALGSSAAHLAQVASGAAGAAVVAEWELWDVGAGVLLVEEAGRVITDLDGAPLDPVGRRGLPLVASARTVTAPLVDAIRVARRSEPQPRPEPRSPAAPAAPSADPSAPARES